MVINAVQTIATMDKCEICARKLQSHSHQILCCVCFNHYHMKCITPSPEDLLKLTNERNETYWNWPMEEMNGLALLVYPIYSLISPLEMKMISSNHNKTHLAYKISLCFYLSDKLFMLFELNDKVHSSTLCDIDPDLHFYQEFNQATVKCNYYLDTKFNEEITEPKGSTNFFLSYCHVNIRSARKNLGAFENYLKILKHGFTVIALTETWLNDNDCDLYGLSVYKVIGRHRVNRTVGGVAVFKRDHVSFRETRPFQFHWRFRNSLYWNWKGESAKCQEYSNWCDISPTKSRYTLV